MVSLWRGQPTQRGRIRRFIGVVVLLLLATFLWRLSMRLIPFVPPTQAVGLVVAVLALLVSLFALWRSIVLIRILGIRRLLIILLLTFIIIVGVRTVTDDRDQTWSVAVVTNTQQTAIAWFKWPLDSSRSTGRFINDFLFAVDGERRPPQLPDGFPMPDPNATPVRIVVPRQN